MKRMLKQLACMTAAVLLAVSSFPAAAMASEGFTGEYERLIDMADLLTYEEESELLETLNEISERQKMDIVLITSEDMDGYSDIQEYADDLYDYCDYGYGANRDGLLLLISMAESDWYISTCGYGITAFTDAGISYLGSAMKEDLSSGNYASAFYTYASECDQMITMAREGHPFSKKDLPHAPLSPLVLPICIVIGLVGAFLIVGSMKVQLKTVRKQTAAANYVKKGSMQLATQQDLFLYSKVDRVKKPEKDSSGSSTHTSSSGTTHGGGGGKF